MTFPKRSSIFLLASALVVLVFTAVPVARATTITVINLDGPGEGFNDPTHVAPVGGNTGVTIGQQRLNVVNHAAGIWASHISSSVVIKVGANFNPLTGPGNCSSTSGILGYAGAVNVFISFKGAPVPNTWYPSALANALAG